MMRPARLGFLRIRATSNPRAAARSHRKASLKLMRSGTTLSISRLVHHYAHKVVGDRKHGEFLVDDNHGLRIEDVHAEVLLEVTPIRLKFPPPSVECRHSRGRVRSVIQERGVECYLARPHAAHLGSIAIHAEQVCSVWSPRVLWKRSGLKVKESHQACDGTATSGGLAGRLAEGLLKGGYIWC